MGVQELINNVDFSKFCEDVVLISEDSTISEPVTILEDVLIHKEMSVHQDLIARNISGFDMEDWQERAVFINRGELEGHYKFENVHIHNFLATDFINDLNMSSVIPLKTDQYIPMALDVMVMSAFRDIEVEGLVNGVKLMEVFQNSAMVINRKQKT